MTTPDDRERLNSLYGKAYTEIVKRVPPEGVYVLETLGAPDSQARQQAISRQLFGDDFPEYRAIPNNGYDKSLWRAEEEAEAQARAADARCQGAEPAAEIRTQDEFLTLLDELLDNTLHDSHCYIEPNDTHCVCIIGRIRAILPPCGAVQLHKAAAHTTWRCLRTAHPSDPSAHIFSEE